MEYILREFSRKIDHKLYDPNIYSEVFKYIKKYQEIADDIADMTREYFLSSVEVDKSMCDTLLKIKFNQALAEGYNFSEKLSLFLKEEEDTAYCVSFLINAYTERCDLLNFIFPLLPYQSEYSYVISIDDGTFVMTYYIVDDKAYEECQDYIPNNPYDMGIDLKKLLEN